MIDIDKTRHFKAILVKVHQLYPQQSLENGGYKIAILRPFANLHIMTSSMTSSIFFFTENFPNINIYRMNLV